jgi:predicted nuclease of predicted toxin-antitoxin system
LVFPSSPPAYLFDEQGQFAAWCKDPGDILSYRQTWPLQSEDLRGASDPSIAKVCQVEQRILITLDLDFANIRNYPPQDYHGIIVLRLARQDRDTVLAMIPVYSRDPAGSLVYCTIAYFSDFESIP